SDLRRLREATARCVDPEDLALAGTRDDRVLLVLRGGGIDRWREVLERLRDALEAAGSRGAIGISAPSGSLELAYAQASACVRLSREIGGTGATAYEDLGALRFVLDPSDPKHTREVVRSLLG